MTSAYVTILRGCKWLVRRWYIPLTALAGVVAFLAVQRRTPKQAVSDELDVIRESENAEFFAIERGANLANQIIDHDYRRTLAELDAAQRKKAHDLRGNPAKRVRYLRRLSDRLRERNQARDNGRQ